MQSALALHKEWISSGDALSLGFEAPGATCLHELSDYGLAQAAAAHDMRALGELYERHKHRVYAVCTRMTRNPAEADDLTQEVFLSLVHKTGSGEFSRAQEHPASPGSSS